MREMEVSKMSLQDDYLNKMVSFTEAVKLIHSGDVVYSAGSSIASIPVMDAISDRVRAGELENIHLLGAQMLTQTKLLDADMAGKVKYTTWFYDAYDRVGYKNEVVSINSVHFSRVTRVMKEYYKPNVLVCEFGEPDEDGYCSFGPFGNFWSYNIVDDVDIIIAVINKHQVKVNSKARLHISKATCFCRDDHPLTEFIQPVVQDVDMLVAAHIVDLIPDGATIQIGRGGLANAIGYGLENKKNLSVHTEILTDSVVELVEKGVIKGKIRTGAGFGTNKVYALCGTDQVSLEDYEVINNPYEIGRYNNFISINSCFMSDLTGQICSEAIGSKQYSSTGGQLDFVKGAALSKGGKSFIALRSTYTDKQGALHSNIVVHLPLGSVVTTPRSEVMYVVSEYGVADLFLKPIEERVKAMISIAHPDFKEQLREEAIAAGIVRQSDLY